MNKSHEQLQTFLMMMLYLTLIYITILFSSCAWKATLICPRQIWKHFFCILGLTMKFFLKSV